MMLPFSVALRVLPGAVQASLAAGGVMETGASGGTEQGGEGTAEAAGAAALAAAGEGAGGGVYGQIARTLPLMKVGMLMMAYVKLLTVKNGQLEDDVRILKGLKVRASRCSRLWAKGTDGRMCAGWLTFSSSSRRNNRRIGCCESRVDEICWMGQAAEDAFVVVVTNAMSCLSNTINRPPTCTHQKQSSHNVPVPTCSPPWRQ